MKISKQELIDMRASKCLVGRFIKQTNNTNKSIEVANLIGGENTYEDLLWMTCWKLEKEKIARFACDVALINIELIKPYTDKYDLIVEFLRGGASRVYSAIDAFSDTTNALYLVNSDANDSDDVDAAHDAVDAASSAVRATIAYTSVDAADDAIDAVTCVSDECEEEINKLLIKLFEDEL